MSEQNPGNIQAAEVQVEAGAGSPAPAGRSWRWVLFARNGIRAGWSALLFVAIFAALMFVAQAAMRPFVHMDKQHPIAPLTGMAVEGVQFLLVVIATWAMARLERRSVLSYGYIADRRLLRFLSGVVAGIVALSALVALLRWKGLLVFDGRLLSGAAAWKFAALWGVVFVLVGFTEESLLRGYLQQTLTRSIGFWWAALLLSIAFGGIHKTNPGESPIGLLSAVGAGLLFSMGLRFTGSLWWVVGLHAGWDWAQSFLYGVADSGLTTQGHLFATHPMGDPLWSGGTTGPEGSIFIVPLLLLMALGIWLVWGRKRATLVA
jgi:hypothetical protein